MEATTENSGTGVTVIPGTEPKNRRTRKCKNIVAVVIGVTGLLEPVIGFPDNIVKLEKAESWVEKNAKEGGPMCVEFYRRLGGIDLTPETKLKKRRT